MPRTIIVNKTNYHHSTADDHLFYPRATIYRQKIVARGFIENAEIFLHGGKSLFYLIPFFS
ncbi:hypothetical protein ABNX05_12000 [Lysinibacillus sp. M3]|uniref:Uncharacterized protein n=2 Tax=Lysinibacillus zambalensis TaxID=3160866 RepID=A0ABV1MS53_9BACI